MNVASAVASKVINLFFVMIIGIVLRKTRVLDKHSTSALSALLVNVTNPFLVICAFQKPYSPELVKNGFIIFGLSVIMHVAASLIGAVSFRFIKDRSRRSIYSFATIFANCGFLGYPVLMALCSSIGDENGLFYGVFFTLFFNIYCWTYGVAVMNGGKGLSMKALLRKILLNPNVIACFVGFGLFILRFTIPSFISEGMNYIGNMTFPVSMLIVGSLFCELNLKEIFRDKALYLYLLIKNILFPIIAIFGLKLIGAPLLFSYILVTMCAMPAASNTAIMADYYGADAKLASKVVGVSTMLSIITIPLIIALAGFVFA